MKKRKTQIDYLLAIRKKTCKSGSIINPKKGGKYKRDKRVYDDNLE